MAKNSYSEKLKDPRWQKKRLEILSRDNFSCLICGDSESTLHVHHRYYINGREPWDYNDNLLATLCDSCHSSEHSLEDISSDLIKMLKCLGFFNSDISGLCILFHCMEIKYPPHVFIAALDKILTSEKGMKDFMDGYFKIIAIENKEKDS
jgi:hypothetical protein